MVSLICLSDIISSISCQKIQQTLRARETEVHCWLLYAECHWRVNIAIQTTLSVQHLKQTCNTISALVFSPTARPKANFVTSFTAYWQ